MNEIPLLPAARLRGPRIRANFESMSYTFYVNLIQRCIGRRLLRPGKQLHARLILSYTKPDNFLASKLMAFYSKTHQLSYAYHVFDQISHKNTFAFNALLIAYAAHSRHREVLKLFALCLSGTGRGEGWDLLDVKPDSYTLSCVLKSMSEVGLDGPVISARIHCYVIKNGHDWDVFVGNGLVTCYSRCDDLTSAKALFDEMPNKDRVTWNSMLAGYSQGGCSEECKDLFRSMLSSGGIKPDGLTFVSVLHSCADSLDLVFGMEVHQLILDQQVEMDLSLCNSILSVYAKCGSLDYAREIFDEMTEKDEITYGTMVSSYVVHGYVDEAMKIFREMEKPGMSVWNAVISGLVQRNQYDNVLDLAREMQTSGLKPNCVTLSSILPAISQVSNLNIAKEMHAYAMKINSFENIYVITAMIDAYAKLGFLRGAQKVFNRAKDRSVIVWTAIISAYAAHGDAKVALTLFYEMLCTNTKPDAVTFTAVLSACAHAGLVDKAWEIFHLELPNYGVEPLPNHYACVVSSLCRAGRLSDAMDFANKIPKGPSAQVWGALLMGASECGDVELAEFVSSRVFELEPENPTNYIVMANLYSKAGRWDEAEKVRDQLKNIGFKKVAGRSRIETLKGLQNFVSLDTSRNSAQMHYYTS